MQYLFFWALNVRFTTDRFVDGELRMRILTINSHGTNRTMQLESGYTYKNNQRMVNPFQIGAITSFEVAF